MSAIDTIPASGEQATTETLPWGFDFSNLLLQGESLSGVTTGLVNRNTGVALSAPASSTNGNVVTVTVVGSTLEAGVSYDLTVTAQALAGKIWTMRFQLRVPGR